MELIKLHEDKILSGYITLSRLYPHIPSFIIWRAWEYAAYQRYQLKEPVLDVGCGDGKFFHLLWPQIRLVVGVDFDRGALAAAQGAGVYREVFLTSAHQLPFQPKCFASAFANCSLEHMDHLDKVLRNIFYSLQPGGTFLLSIVTNKLVEWKTLPLMVQLVDEPERARSLQAEYERYHHLVNPLSCADWISRLGAAGFEVLECVPILPEMTSRLFLFLDHLWHVKRPGGELGDLIYPLIAGLPEFSTGFQQILSGFLQMETHWDITSGAVFQARRKL